MNLRELLNPINILILGKSFQDYLKNLLIEIKNAIEEDQCEAIILGCAGMTDLTPWLSKEAGIPVIDGVVSALKIVEALIGAGLKTSKAGGYSTPIPKEF